MAWPAVKTVGAGEGEWPAVLPAPSGLGPQDPDRSSLKPPDAEVGISRGHRWGPRPPRLGTSSASWHPDLGGRGRAGRSRRCTGWSHPVLSHQDCWAGRHTEASPQGTAPRLLVEERAPFSPGSEPGHSGLCRPSAGETSGPPTRPPVPDVQPQPEKKTQTTQFSTETCYLPRRIATTLLSMSNTPPTGLFPVTTTEPPFGQRVAGTHSRSRSQALLAPGRGGGAHITTCGGRNGRVPTFRPSPPARREKQRQEGRER